VVAVLIGIFSISAGFNAVLDQSGADDIAMCARHEQQMTSGLSQGRRGSSATRLACCASRASLSPRPSSTSWWTCP
jgi:hypothetical protein